MCQYAIELDTESLKVFKDDYLEFYNKIKRPVFVHDKDPTIKHRLGFQKIQSALLVDSGVNIRTLSSADFWSILSLNKVRNKKKQKHG